METKYYEYIGTQEQADNYAEPIPIVGNIYPINEKIGGEKVSFWLISTSLGKEWNLVEKELSTEELIELLNKKAAKDGMTCLVTFQKKPGIEITDFHLSKAYKNGFTRVVFYVDVENLQVQSKEKQLIEAIKNVLEND
jgi:prephenate dehydratase